ncbi:type IV pilus assembly protein PilV [Chitinivorax tropicus]|uniref:Type IV pilus assembly protein PilV n=1 Tax=Chitinivorax tropicus TaxID=714531 RepID=A0A840MSQ8_9PROT|nr:hypothetical protein [Chitinivorax tropicus]MBB5019802.1 type IV pilus assembly protein PilV [Chitinivorax tropicus]
MLTQFSNSMPKYQHGAMLLEGLIAILIFSFGLLAIVGLQGQAVRDVSDARGRIDATYVMNRIVGELWLKDPKNLKDQNTDYDDASTDIGKLAISLPNGKANVKVSNKIVTVTLTWKPPAAKDPNKLVTVTAVNEALKSGA